MTAPDTLAPVEPQRQLWGFWPTVGLSATILVTFFAAQIAVSLVAFLVLLYSGGLGFQETLEAAASGLVLSLATIVSVPLGLLLVVVFIRLRGNISVADYLGFRRIKWGVVAILALLFVAMLAVVSIIGSYLGDSGDANFNTELYLSSGFPPLLWLAVVFLAPLFEEVFFRGFLFVGLRASRLGVIATVILTSLLWAILHIQYNLFGITQILGMGLILGTVRHKTDSLWGPLIIHALWNGVATASVALYGNFGG